jgi:hypothetical protein
MRPWRIAGYKHIEGAPVVGYSEQNPTFHCVLSARLRAWGKFRSLLAWSKRPDLLDLPILCYSQRSTEPSALLGHAPNPVYGFGIAVRKPDNRAYRRCGATARSSAFRRHARRDH